MEKKHDICRKTIEDKINESIPFGYNEICEEIRNKGGILRVSPRFTVEQYLTHLKERKIIEYKLQNIRYLNERTSQYSEKNILMFVPISTKSA